MHLVQERDALCLCIYTHIHTKKCLQKFNSVEQYQSWHCVLQRKIVKKLYKLFPLHFKTEFEQFLLWKSTALSHVWQFPLHPSRFANSFCKIWQMSFANFLPSMKLCSSSMSKTIDFLNWIIEQKRKGIGKKNIPHYRTERLLFISLENCIEDFGVGQYYAKPEMRHKTLEV